EIDLLHQRPLGAGVLTLVLGNAFQRDVALLVQPFLNAKAGRSGGAIDEDGGLFGVADRVRLGVGQGHGAFLSSVVASLVAAVSVMKACGRTLRIRLAISLASASPCDASALLMAA